MIPLQKDSCSLFSVVKMKNLPILTSLFIKFIAVILESPIPKTKVRGLVSRTSTISSNSAIFNSLLIRLMLSL